MNEWLLSVVNTYETGELPVMPKSVVVGLFDANTCKTTIERTIEHSGAIRAGYRLAVSIVYYLVTGYNALKGVSIYVDKSASIGNSMPVWMSIDKASDLNDDIITVSGFFLGGITWDSVGSRRATIVVLSCDV